MTHDPTCLRCNRPLSEHHRYTAQDIELSRSAHWWFPAEIGGGVKVRAPLSPGLIGRWAFHDPMLRSSEDWEPEQADPITAAKADADRQAFRKFSGDR